MWLEVMLVRGRNLKRNGQVGKCWLCVLADSPHPIIRIPEFAIVGEVAAGDTDILIELRSCGFTTELEQTLWKMEMQRDST